LFLVVFDYFISPLCFAQFVSCGFDYFITPGHFCAYHRFGVCQIEDSIAFFWENGTL